MQMKLMVINMFSVDWCQECESCQNEKETLCENPKYLGARLNGVILTT